MIENSYPRPYSRVNLNDAQPEQKQLPKGVVWKHVDLTQYENTDGQLWLTKERLHAVWEKSGLPYIDTRSGKQLKKFDEKWNGFAARPDYAPALLYQIKKVRQAIREGKTVYIMEGELKAKALEAWGFVATCNEHGANAWTEAHGFLLGSSPNAAHAHFVILNDADQVGQDWADDVGRSIVNQLDVRLLALTGTVNDVVDWIAAGHTKQEFEQLVPTKWKAFSPPRSKVKAQAIQKIEILPGQIETFRVTMEEGGVVTVDAAALSDFRQFNRASISQLRRSFSPPQTGAWNAEVDRALRAAPEPDPPQGEQLRFHGTPNWGNGDMSWLVRERLPEQGVGLISGRYSTFKSFVLLDLCGSVVAGLPFLKARTIRRGGALIFAAEGAGDIPMRMKALVKHRLTVEISPDLFAERQINLDRLPFSYAGDCRPLLDPKTVDWMKSKAHEAQDFFHRQFGFDLVLVGVDTLSAAAGWDNENDAAQAQMVMNNLKDLSVAANCCVLAVDHFGKDISAGTRGSIVKESSADFILSTLGEIDPDTDVVTDSRLVMRKLRSGPQGAVFPFEAKVVDMGLDRFNEPLTSRVLDWNVARPTRRRARTQAQSILEQALAETFAAHAERVVIDGREREAIRYANLQMAYRRLYVRDKPDASKDAINMALKRARGRMEGLITETTLNEVKYLWYSDNVM